MKPNQLNPYTDEKFSVFDNIKTKKKLQLLKSMRGRFHHNYPRTSYGERKKKAKRAISFCSPFTGITLILLFLLLIYIFAIGYYVTMTLKIYIQLTKKIDTFADSLESLSNKLSRTDKTKPQIKNEIEYLKRIFFFPNKVISKLSIFVYPNLESQTNQRRTSPQPLKNNQENKTQSNSDTQHQNQTNSNLPSKTKLANYNRNGLLYFANQTKKSMVYLLLKKTFKKFVCLKRNTPDYFVTEFISYNFRERILQDKNRANEKLISRLGEGFNVKIERKQAFFKRTSTENKLCLTVKNCNNQIVTFTIL